MKLYYSVNCGKDCEYYTDEHKKEKWKDAMLYDEMCQGYEVSNFGGITKDGKNVERYLNEAGDICVKINKSEIVLYKMIASTFLKVPDGGYYENNKRRKTIHHRDNNSKNFNPDNMVFVVNHLYEQPHLTLRNFNEWGLLIDKICKNEK